MQINKIIIGIAKLFPKLKGKLLQAGITDEPAEFIRKTLITSLYMSFGLAFFLFLVLSRYINPLYILATWPIAIILSVLFFMYVPDVKIRKLEKSINKEILFAARFLLIEIQSGVPLYDSFKSVADNYETSGKYFREVINKVDLGTSMEEALNEASELVPSDAMRRVMWQILNSMKTGTDISRSLGTIIENITKEQRIEIETYARKLNPLAMFYMIIAVIIPSLGITMLIILSTFIKLQIDLPALLALAGFLAFMQYMFLSIIKFSRPSVEL